MIILIQTATKVEAANFEMILVRHEKRDGFNWVGSTKLNLVPASAIIPRCSPFCLEYVRDTIKMRVIENARCLESLGSLPQMNLQSPADPKQIQDWGS
ncbi:hypothetical protein AOL_s00176g16 [Orbilia oligospora ATCC 24927]|uniref:Uncharacterized protein n=1 Tax=Arthrobotrys oligospora (strain ATCC 24927 / CBS 115.81 / DSM 1491) TaxID=756982 RepID=G1XPP2_ARTOA|nr:hypothetical protein AOL_s00176g16 [Orbilia oligospora ATCC 24927]EGX44845.1 hypothetical protein AOL_s00176g16 [Orbilia oligospora ATCC 24927]